MATGDTWEQIENDWDIPRLQAMNKYWKRYPPLHILVQAFMGELPDSKPAIDVEDQDSGQPDLVDMLQAFPQAR